MRIDSSSPVKIFTDEVADKAFVGESGLPFLNHSKVPKDEQKSFALAPIVKLVSDESKSIFGTERRNVF